MMQFNSSQCIQASSCQIRVFKVRVKTSPREFEKVKFSAPRSRQEAEKRPPARFEGNGGRELQRQVHSLLRTDAAAADPALGAAPSADALDEELAQPEFGLSRHSI